MSSSTHRFFVHQVAPFPSTEHLQVLHSSLKDSEGKQEKVGSLNSCNDTILKFDVEIWCILFFKQPFRVQAAKPENNENQIHMTTAWQPTIEFSLFIDFLFTCVSTETWVAIFSPCCARRTFLIRQISFKQNFCVRFKAKHFSTGNKSIFYTSFTIFNGNLKGSSININ